MSNPWLPDQWNYTAQGQYVVEHGLEAAHKAAAAAGTTLNGKPKQPDTNAHVIERHWIIQKKRVAGGAGGGGGGGALVGAGSSGSGAPTG